MGCRDLIHAVTICNIKEDERMAKGDVCEVENCGSTKSVCMSSKYNMKICSRHNGQLRQYGKIFTRTCFDKNEIVICDGYAEVILYNPQHEENGRARIDIEDIDKVKDYKWKLSKQGYAASGRDSILMHRVITDAPKGLVVDHIDHILLHNCKVNLRVCTHSDNGANQVVQKNSKSGITGVYYNAKRGLWIAQIMKNYEHISLGESPDREVAIAYRKAGEELYQGKFAFGATLCPTLKQSVTEEVIQCP
jgi:hypothetical protein